MKKCAVIVAAYKAAPYIGAMLESFDKLKKLDGWEWELRIGVDACPETARELDIQGVPYETALENVGAYVMRNSLIAKGRADCYAIFDADDTFDPDYLASLVPLAEKYGFAASHKRVVSESGDIIEADRSYGGGQCVFTHETLERLGGFRSSRVSSDLDFTLRAMQSGINIAVSPCVLWSYRRTPGSLTGNPETDCNSKYRAGIEAKHEELRAFHGVKIKPETINLQRTDLLSLSGFESRVSVIAFAPDGQCEYRKRIWENLRPYWLKFGFELVEVTADSGAAFNKASLAHAGAAAAHGDILIFADADVFMDRRAILRAVNAVGQGFFGWAAPNSHVLRLINEESKSVLNGGLAIPSNAPYIGQYAGGVFVISRKCWQETNGMDTRFEGWGGEDTAYSSVLVRRGDGWKPRGREILWHLWHPEQPSKVPGKCISKNDKNTTLMRQYLAGAVDKAPDYKGEDMKIEILASTRIEGRHCEKGSIVDADAKTAFALIRWGFASPAKTEGARRDEEAVAESPENIQTEPVKKKVKK